MLLQIFKTQGQIYTGMKMFGDIQKINYRIPSISSGLTFKFIPFPKWTGNKVCLLSQLSIELQR